MPGVLFEPAGIGYKVMCGITKWRPWEATNHKIAAAGDANHKWSRNEFMYNSNSGSVTFLIEDLFKRIPFEMNILFKGIGEHHGTGDPGLPL